MKVTWKLKMYDADAEKVYAELQNIDKCTPQNIVDYARDENTELHKCFTWNDTEAAEKWRKNEARCVVRLLVYTNSEEEAEPSPVRVMYHEKESESYIPTRIIARNEDSYRKLLESAYSELQTFKKKYGMLTELEEILALID